jgi:hypothetical protein
VWARPQKANLPVAGRERGGLGLNCLVNLTTDQELLYPWELSWAPESRRANCYTSSSSRSSWTLTGLSLIVDLVY